MPGRARDTDVDAKTLARHARPRLGGNIEHGIETIRIDEVDEALADVIPVAEEERLASVTLPAASPHAGRPLDDLALHALGVAVVSMRRANGKGLLVDGATLAGGDTLVLSGMPAALALAEEKLLSG